jgi:hypothetical protein
MMNTQANSSSRESMPIEGGRTLTIERTPTGARYSIDGKPLYETDAGSLLHGILIWNCVSSEVLLPVGARRRDRAMKRAPRALAKTLASRTAVRVFCLPGGGLWAVERPGQSILVRDEAGEPLEIAYVRNGVIGEIECERPWAALPESLHVARIALWAQILGTIAPTEAERALADRIRIAAFAAGDSRACTVAEVARHPALAGADLGPWAKRLSRKPPSANRPSQGHRFAA